MRYKMRLSLSHFLGYIEIDSTYSRYTYTLMQHGKHVKSKLHCIVVLISSLSVHLVQRLHWEFFIIICQRITTKKVAGKGDEARKKKQRSKMNTLRLNHSLVLFRNYFITISSSTSFLDVVVVPLCFCCCSRCWWYVIA